MNSAKETRITEEDSSPNHFGIAVLAEESDELSDRALERPHFPASCNQSYTTRHPGTDEE